jgi:hypothetical protein
LPQPLLKGDGRRGRWPDAIARRTPVPRFFVDRKHRGRSVATAALEGALDQIAQAGGGLVEAISEVTDGRLAQGRFLFSATVELLEQVGVVRGRQVGKHAWIVSRVVDPV